MRNGLVHALPAVLNRAQMNFLLTFETAQFFCEYPVLMTATMIT
jgi:hypothetical protein